MKSYAYAESVTLSRKNQYSERNSCQKKPAARVTTAREKQERWSNDQGVAARPSSTTRVRRFWEGYSGAMLEKPGEAKAAYELKSKPIKFDLIGLKNKITRRPFHRFDQSEQIDASNRYDILINEYQRLVDLELSETIGMEDKIKRAQIEAELDAIEAKRAMETQGENTYRSDIDKLKRLIELAEEIRALT